MNNKKVNSREVAEEAEGLKQVNNDVPENRMQNTQQIQNTDAALKVDAPTGSFQKKTANAKGSTLKQEKISEALTGSSESSGMSINAGGRGVSGAIGGILGANNSTPQAGKARSDSRVGKKLDRIATKLNSTPCENSLVPVQESKPLAEASDEDQGYNGTYRNEAARSQKKVGAVPGDLLYQRSVDFIMKDKLYFLEGQQVYQNSSDDSTHTGDRYDFNPSQVYNPNASPSPKWENRYMKSGNYLHRNMHIGLNDTGKVDYWYFDVDDITAPNVSAEQANVASAHRLIKSNVAELDRMNMDAKAGDEKADIWTDLARAIKEPTKWSYLMSSIEAETGGYVYLAYSKASTNFSFQLNRALKDGLDAVTPAVEQLIGWRNYNSSSSAIKSSYTDLQPLFNKSYYKLGDPSLMIAAYDSPKKYHNKADLLLQAKGWRMHLQTADNNMNSLKVPKEYANVFAGTEVFSTIEHDYDPVLPICYTDKANLITTHNFNEYGAYLSNFAKNLKFTYTLTKLAEDYEYKKYTVLKNLDIATKMQTARHLYGWYGKNGGDGFDWDKTTGELILDADTNNGTRSVKVIFKEDSTTPVEDGWTFTQIKYGANNTGTDLLLYDHDITVRVPKIQSSSDTVITAVTVDSFVDTGIKLVYKDQLPLKYYYADLRNNYTVDMKHPLIEGILEYLRNEAGGSFAALLDGEELFVPMIFSTQYMTLAQLLICAATPWIQRVREKSMVDVIYYENNVHEYPYSKLASIKDVPFKNYVNFNYSDYDHPLETKIMNPVQAINWIMPEFFWKVDTATYVLPWYFNENELNSDGSIDEDASCMSMPSIRNGIKFSFFDTLYGMSEKDLRLSLDRMTKSFFETMIGEFEIDSIYAYKYGRTTDGQPCVKLDNDTIINVYKVLSCPRELGLQMDCPLGILTKDPADAGLYKDLDDDGVSTSFRIKIYTNEATDDHISILADSNVNISRAADYTQKWIQITANLATSDTDVAGLVFGMNDDSHEFSPFAALGTGASASSGITINSFMRSINTRLQFLPFVISPFDGIPNSGNNHDIYDFAYYFGLAGFRASDYRESVYNRSKEVVNQGFLFVEDPWILASPIMKDASKTTGLHLDQGYTLSK